MTNSIKKGKDKCLCGKLIPAGRRKYCSNNCVKKAWKLRNPQKVKEQERKDNKKWKLYQSRFDKKYPGKINGFKRAWHIKRNFGGIDMILNTVNPSCHFCGTFDIRKLCVHHKNRNKSDNKETNLIILCNSCHGKLHALARKFIGE